DNQASATWQASTGNPDSTTSNIVHVITQASSGNVLLTITKTASQATARPNDLLTFTLNVVNSGTADAAPVAVTIDGMASAKIVVRDAIPNNTRFSAITSAAPALALYHVAGPPAQSYVTSPPANLSTVDAVAFALNTFAAGASASFSFGVTVNSNASGALSN